MLFLEQESWTNPYCNKQETIVEEGKLSLLSASASTRKSLFWGAKNSRYDRARKVGMYVLKQAELRGFLRHLHVRKVGLPMLAGDFRVF